MLPITEATAHVEAKIYAVVEINLPHVEGATRSEILLDALLKADIMSIPGATGELAKCVLVERRPGAEEEISVYHDTLHLEALLEERLDGAGVFDPNALLAINIISKVSQNSPGVEVNVPQGSQSSQSSQSLC